MKLICGDRYQEGNRESIKYNYLPSGAGTMQFRIAFRHQRADYVPGSGYVTVAEGER